MADPDRFQAQQDKATVLMLVLDTSAMSAAMHGIEGAIDRLRDEAPEQVLLVAPVAAEISGRNDGCASRERNPCCDYG